MYLMICLNWHWLLVQKIFGFIWMMLLLVQSSFIPAIINYCKVWKKLTRCHSIFTDDRIVHIQLVMRWFIFGDLAPISSIESIDDVERTWNTKIWLKDCGQSWTSSILSLSTRKTLVFHSRDSSCIFEHRESPYETRRTRRSGCWKSRWIQQWIWSMKIYSDISKETINIVLFLSRLSDDGGYGETESLSISIRINIRVTKWLHIPVTTVSSTIYDQVFLIPVIVRRSFDRMIEWCKACEETIN